MKSLLKKQEFYISCLLLLIVIIISLVNPSFLNLGNIFSLLKSSIVLGILALGVLLVLITGGIDVSFPVVAGFSLYTGAMIFAKYYPSTPLILVFLYAMAVGSFCGFLNGFLIAHFKFPALVVTLGSSSAISGFMYTFIGTRPIKKLPDSLVEFGKKMFFERDTEAGFIGLPTAILILIALCLIVYFMLRYTMFGRYIFALGGDEISAERAGINTQLVKILVYVIVGALAGIAGVIRISFL
ncbi:MAG: hypothetical protein B0D92_03290, partial [Spirochaeta sp. LUC14_002_19_P3]